MNGTTPVHLTIDRRLDDYLEAFQTVMGPRLLRLALAAFVVLVLGELARGFLNLRDGPLNATAWLLADVGIAALVWAIGYWSTIYLTAHKMYRAHRRITGSSYTFDDAGMQYASSTTSSFTKWDAFAGFRETPSLFLLFYPNRLFQLVPKRCVEDGRTEDLRDLLIANLRTRGAAR